MNRLIMIYGCVLLSSTAIAAIQGSPFELTPLNKMEQDIAMVETPKAVIEKPTSVALKAHSTFADTIVDETYDLDLSKIEFIEEEVVDLGFDPYDYLPSYFNPYSYYVDLSTIEFNESDELNLDFDTAKYLPSGFDAHKESMALSSIYYMEEEEIDLGFETRQYLPEGFSPYEPYFDLNSINYIEMDDLEEDYFVWPNAEVPVEEPLN